MKKRYGQTQERLRWSRTVGAHNCLVDHTAIYRDFKCTVTNYPGSRTLMWRIEHTNYTMSRVEDRAEHGVGSLKERCVEKVDEFYAKQS